MEHYQIKQLADGVFAAIATDQGWAGCNAGIVTLGERVLLFDTACTLPAAEQLHSLVGRLAGRPATHVVNSHVHDDHINGNLPFASTATILATERVRDGIVTKQRHQIRNIWGEVQEGIDALSERLAQVGGGAAQADLAGELAALRAFQGGLPAVDELRAPHLTFTGQLTFYGGDREAQLIDCGAGHSESDTVLYLPEEGLLFTGDLITSENLVLRYSDPAAWLAVLERLAALKPRLVIPGHGPIESGPVALERCRRYLTGMMQQVRDALKGGATAAYADQVPVPVGYGERWYRDNIRFLLSWLAERA